MRSKKRWLLPWLVLALAVGGCGGASTSFKAASSVREGKGAERSAASPMEPSAAAPPLGDAESSRDFRAQSRPGLGTEWGETRTSRVRDVAFVRESSAPFATVTIHYDDRRGVDALAEFRARRERTHDVDAGGAVTVSIRDEDGRPLEAVRAGDRAMVVGHAGDRYTIRLTNHTGHRIESVVTVDGLDVINGQPGTRDNRGYVLLPFATLEIEGFRRNASSVAAFRFGAVADAYAAQVGSGRNVGVIGAAFFDERGDALTLSRRDLRMRDTADPFPADPRPRFGVRVE